MSRRRGPPRFWASARYRPPRVRLYWGGSRPGAAPAGGATPRRAYSLSSSILGDAGRLLDLDATDWLEFYIVLVRETGEPERAPGLTPRLFMLREGDRLQVGDRVTGHFTLDGVKPTDAVVFLS